MNAATILFSKSHLLSPFTITDKNHNNTIRLSTVEKVAAVAVAILVGALSFGIGGVIAFYTTTAIMKAQKVKNAPHEADESRKKVVAFAGARARVFDKNQPAKEVAKAHSHEVANFAKPANLEDALKRMLSHFGKCDPYPTSIAKRRVPPLSQVDTIMMVSGVIKSVHGDGTEKLFTDQEILKLHPSIRRVDIGNNIQVDIVENNKVVIQQQATRGCTAAAAAMLIHDAGKNVDLSSLQQTNLGNTKSIVSSIEKADLTPVVTELNTTNNSKELLKQLQQLLRKNGSAIVSTSHDIGSHVVVVDHISDNLNEVRLRDPYHGWDITVTKEAFMRGFHGGDIIQLVNK